MSARLQDRAIHSTYLWRLYVTVQSDTVRYGKLPSATRVSTPNIRACMLYRKQVDLLHFVLEQQVTGVACPL